MLCMVNNPIKCKAFWENISPHVVKWTKFTEY